MYSPADYHFSLPEALIAQTPLAQREHARLLRLEKRTGQTSHHRFTDIREFLSPGDALVINNTAVVPARLIGRKQSGGKAEVLIIDYATAAQEPGQQNRRRHQCLIKASIRPRPSTILVFDTDLFAEVIAFDNGIFTVDFFFEGEFDPLLYRLGKVPLPHYIRRAEDAPNSTTDVTAYQTVYAAEKGAAAAPTAGLHFTRPLLERIAQRGVSIAPITLHVGYGTFVPIRVTDIREHRMHAETFSVSESSARIINDAKANGGRVVAVGTTSVRTLEFIADDRGYVPAGGGRCDLFIYPGYRFKAVDAMITNFHLPESTLLMLVSAFAGKESVLAAYAEAVREEYRFFSYGDAMFIG